MTMAMTVITVVLSFVVPPVVNLTGRMFPVNPSAMWRLRERRIRLWINNLRVENLWLRRYIDRRTPGGYGDGSAIRPRAEVYLRLRSVLFVRLDLPPKEDRI
jgi:hypothetical protein